MTSEKIFKASSRRWRFGFFSTVLLLAATASVVLAAAIADRYSTRIDATATREHSLSERTRALIGQIENPVEIVLVADDRTLDARARQRVNDVLHAFEEAEAPLAVTRINPVTDAGRAEFEQLRTRVKDLYASDLSRRREAVEAAAESGASLIDRLGALSESLLALQSPLQEADNPLAAQVVNVAAAARIQARELSSVVQQGRESTEAESARAMFVNEFSSLRDQLHQFAGELNAAAAEAIDGSPIQAGWRQAHELAASIRDEAARLQAAGYVRRTTSLEDGVAEYVAALLALQPR